MEAEVSIRRRRHPFTRSGDPPFQIGARRDHLSVGGVSDPPAFGFPFWCFTEPKDGSTQFHTGSLIPGIMGPIPARRAWLYRCLCHAGGLERSIRAEKAGFFGFGP